MDLAQGICVGNGSLGNEAQLRQTLNIALEAAGCDGQGVLLAVVDGGIDLAWLRGRGLTAAFDGPGASRREVIPGHRSRRLPSPSACCTVRWPPTTR